MSLWMQVFNQVLSGILELKVKEVARLQVRYTNFNIIEV